MDVNDVPQEGNCTLGSHRRKLRVGATLESLGGFGMQLDSAWI